MTEKVKRPTGWNGVKSFLTRGACSHTLCHALNDVYGQQLKAEERASEPLAGGIMNHGYQCGMLWGSALAAGARAHQLFGPGPKAEAVAIAAAQKNAGTMEATFKSFNCFEITEMKMQSAMDIIKFMILKGGPITCGRMIARYTPLAFDDIEGAAAGLIEPPAAPVSCAAVVAQRLGASRLQQSMAAGLAGGIGLAGGACGALGATIWVLGMQTDKLKVGFSGPNDQARALIDRFLKNSEFEFECEKIVGRKFESVADHAGYIQGGGCAKILEGLAAEATL